MTKSDASADKRSALAVLAIVILEVLVILNPASVVWLWPLWIGGY